MSKIAIIGAGISGLSVAYLLINKKYKTEIFARAFSPNITSNKAAAFWFPYHIRNDKRGIEWCRKSYEYYQQLSSVSETGVSMQKLIKVVRKEVDEEKTWIDFLPENSFRKLDADELNEKYKEGYEIIVPLIETQIFLPWMHKELKKHGVQFHEKEIQNFDEIKNDYDAMVNCSGLGSRELCNDKELIPVRGQVGLLLAKNGLNILLNTEKPLYIVPRKDAIIIGGTYEDGIETENTESFVIEKLLANAYDAMPELLQQQFIGSWSGIRPYRLNVRVEREPNTNIIHNYGHGGSGFTLAFGCAEEVVRLIKEIVVYKL
ncbi:MAG: FAD-dependent oxidoreductase [Parafilimonas sp.]